MESKHTKGNWKIKQTEICEYEIYTDEMNIATVWEMDIDPEEGEANAKLIAAAPELLEELIGFCDNAIIDKKIAENQLAYFRARFLKVINKATI